MIKEIAVIIFIIVSISLSGWALLGKEWNDQPNQHPALSDKTKLSICQRKAFTTAEGILLSPYGKKIKGQPDDLWIIGYFDEDLKLAVKEEKR